jgi:hypothetical protein
MRPLVLFPKIQPIEDKDTSNAQVFKSLQLFLDVASQGERKTSQGDEKRFAGGGVEEMLGDVVRRINADDSPFKCGEGKRRGAGRDARDPIV